MYSKIVNSPNMDKNRVLSTQVSPGLKQKMSKNTSKELFIRNKRTLTDRAALIRAWVKVFFFMIKIVFIKIKL